MERFADAYGRVLFPSRYGPAKGTTAAGTRVDGGHPMTLPPGGLELDISAGIYRLVCAAEGLVDGLRRLRLGWRAGADRRPTATPLGCG